MLLVRSVREGELDVGCAIDADDGLGGVAGAPFVVVRLEEILADGFEHNAAAEGTGRAEVHSLIGVDLLSGELAGEAVHLIELKLEGQVEFGLYKDEVPGRGLLIGVDRAGGADVGGETVGSEGGANEGVAGMDVPPGCDGDGRREFEA